MENMTISRTNVINAFESADKSQKALLEALFGKETFKPKKITDRVKTFEDACEVVGEDPEDMKNALSILEEDDIIAYAKLKIIIQALREGWKPDYSDGSQRKWYPWFEWDNSKSGFRFDGACYVCTFTNSGSGSRLCLPTEELAKYVGTQFIDLYNQFLNS